MVSDRSSASRVVRALGFGGSAELVDEVVRVGVPDWAASSLAAARAQGPRAAPPAVGGSEQPPEGADREQRRAFRKEQREKVSSLVRWWLTEMATTPHPVLERVAFGWHDHFATSAVKVRDPSFVLGQNETLRRLALGGFGELAHAMAVDPAMLVWLDGVRNTRKAPNENLARELMELFCLGGGYTESDVKAGAQALTGWVYARRSGRSRGRPAGTRATRSRCSAARPGWTRRVSSTRSSPGRSPHPSSPRGGGVVWSRPRRPSRPPSSGC